MSLIDNPGVNLAISELQKEADALMLCLKEGKISNGTSDNLMAHYHFYVGKIEGLEYLKKFVDKVIDQSRSTKDLTTGDNDE